MLRSGDFSMIKVWAGLEARQFITVSVEEVRSHLVLLYVTREYMANDHDRLSAVSNMTNCRQMFELTISANLVHATYAHS